MFLPPPPSVIVHILHDNTLTPENREKFAYIAGRYGQVVKFYNVEILCADKIAQIQNYCSEVEKSVFTVGTLYRFLISDVVDHNITKIIYLDSDIIVNLDIGELWNVDLQGKILAAGAEREVDYLGYMIKPPRHYLVAENFIRSEDYFVAGLMVMNLEKMRNSEEIIKNGMKFYAEHPQCKYFDQDILNYCFAKDYVHLPRKFGAFVGVERHFGRNAVQRIIYHYAGGALNLDCNDELNFLWFKYLAQTPFFTAETVKNLYWGIRRLNIQGKKFATDVSAIMSGKERAFFVPPNNIEAARQVFHIKPEEEIISADSLESIQNLLESMNFGNGRKIFFILVNGFPQVHDALTSAGFIFGRDYLNALEFFSEAEGVPLNSYQLVKLL